MDHAQIQFAKEGLRQAQALHDRNHACYKLNTCCKPSPSSDAWDSREAAQDKLDK
jgi:hypothetical protein